MTKLTDAELIEKYIEHKDDLVTVRSTYGCIEERFTLHDIIRMAELVIVGRSKIEGESCYG